MNGQQVVTFPHANGYEVPLADFLQAWQEVVQRYAPAQHENPLDCPLPRLHTRHRFQEHYNDGRRQFCLEYLCRTLIPPSYRNTMQATQPFMSLNERLLIAEPVLNPKTGRIVSGARLREPIVLDTDNSTKIKAIFEADYDIPEKEDGPDVNAPLPPIVQSQQADYDCYVERLTKQIQDDLFIQFYRSRPTGVQATGWTKRFEAYFWPSPATGYHAVNAAVAKLETAAKYLALALPNWTDQHKIDAVALANKIFEWGGVPQDQATVTPDNIRKVFDAAISGTLPQGEAPPMNSGWTKVAAFASAHLETEQTKHPQVIWDSRVATAITSRLEKLFKEKHLEAVPACFSDIGTVKVGRGGTRPRQLKLRWRNGYQSWSAQFAGSKLVAAIRDKLNSDPAMFGRMPGGNNDGRWTVRGVEMVLFMDGY